MKRKKSYYDHTSILGKKIGDGLLAASTTLSAYAIIEEIKWLALTALFVGVIGKFLTNLFTDEKTT